MIIVRVINISKSDITIRGEVIKAKQIRDFAENSLSSEDLKTIAAYSASGVVKAYSYEKSDNVIVNNIDSADIDTTQTTNRKSRKR